MCYTAYMNFMGDVQKNKIMDKIEIGHELKSAITRVWSCLTNGGEKYLNKWKSDEGIHVSGGWKKNKEGKEDGRVCCEKYMYNVRCTRMCEIATKE